MSFSTDHQVEAGLDEQDVASSGAVTAGQVLTLALTSARWTHDVSPLLLQAAMPTFVEPTTVAPP